MEGEKIIVLVRAPEELIKGSGESRMDPSLKHGKGGNRSHSNLENAGKKRA